LYSDPFIYVLTKYSRYFSWGVIYMINEAKEKYYSLIVEPHIWYHIRIQYGNMSFIENIGYNAFRIHLWYVFHWKYRLQAFRINLQCDPEIKKTKLIKRQAG
jgi:hypothetical protein